MKNTSCQSEGECLWVSHTLKVHINGDKLGPRAVAQWVKGMLCKPEPELDLWTHAQVEGEN